LRDKNDPDTIAYLTAENTYADAWFTECTPSIDTLFEEIKSRVVETDMSVPVRHGGWWYVTRTQEGLAYPIHCRGTTKDTAHTQVLIDENAEAQGHEYFALGVAELSDDHTLMAWSRDLDGSEQYEMRIRDLTTTSLLRGERRNDAPLQGDAPRNRHPTIRRCGSVRRPRRAILRRGGPHTIGKISRDRVRLAYVR